MATYIVGDVHGYYQTLLALLEVIEFNKKKDTIYLTGDLVNGGKESAAVMRWAMEHASIVLGNHDLHMLAVWHGRKFVRKKDTFYDVFSADDAKQLLGWMRKQPLLRIEEEFALCHAGIYPAWGLSKAKKRAEEAELLYQGKKPGRWFQSMYGNQPSTWAGAERKVERFRFIINAFTRMRTVSIERQELNMQYSGALHQIKPTHVPWYRARETGWSKRVFFGHWAAHGLQINKTIGCLDSGVRWGGPLTAYRLEDQALFQHPRIKKFTKK